MKASCLSNDLRLLTGSTAVDCCVARTLLPNDHQGACEQQVSTGSITPTPRLLQVRPLKADDPTLSSPISAASARRCDTRPPFNDVVHAHCILPDRDFEPRRRET